MIHTTPREKISVLNRLGFHYFPDTFHYREIDRTTWLPKLQELGAGWVVLQSDAERAIPESFITSLIDGGIQPIVQFHLPLARPIPQFAARHC